jgi:hypothetical protein
MLFRLFFVELRKEFDAPASVPEGDAACLASGA